MEVLGRWTFFMSKVPLQPLTLMSMNPLGGHKKSVTCMAGIKSIKEGKCIRLPGKGNSNSHGARQVHLIITMMKWIWTSRVSIKNSLSLQTLDLDLGGHLVAVCHLALEWCDTLHPTR